MVISRSAKRKRKEAAAPPASVAAPTATPSSSHSTAAANGGGNSSNSNTSASASPSTTAATQLRNAASLPSTPSSLAGPAPAAPSTPAIASSPSAVPSMSEAVTPMTPEAPKRTKVHAQRKFAQNCAGGGPPGTTTFVHPNNVAQRSNNHPASESVSVLPNNQRPTTENFLKFLCFRGTSVLPPHLDYLGTRAAAAAVAAADRSFGLTSTPPQSTRATATSVPMATQHESTPPPAATSVDVQRMSEPTPTTTNTGGDDNHHHAPAVQSSSPSALAPSTTTPAVVCETVTEPTKAVVSKRTTPPATAPAAASNPPPPPPSTFIPFAVRKQAETVSDGGKRRQAVQALKKKYQEQRMAKTQVQALISNKAKQRGRSGSDGLASNRHSSTDIATTEAPAEKQTAKPTVSDKTRPAEQRDDATTTVAKSSSTTPTPTKSTPTKERPASVASDHESVHTTDTKSTRQRKSTKKGTPDNHMPTRLTRQHALAYPESYRRAEEAALAGIRQAEQQQAKSQQTKGRKSATKPNECATSAKASRIADFSSDDDRPLAKAVKAIKRTSTARSDSEERPTPKGRAAKKSATNSAAKKVISDQSPATSGGAAKKRAKNDSDNATATAAANDGGGADSLAGSDETPTSKKKLMDSIESQMKSFGEDAQWDADAVAVTAPAVLCPPAPATASAVAADDGANRRDADDAKDNQTRPRPSRKSKEAAAIYMELIGHRLNLGADSDDDDDNDNRTSQSSMPELPNLKKTEQIESELKAAKAATSKADEPIATASSPPSNNGRESAPMTTPTRSSAGRAGKSGTTGAQQAPKRKIDRKNASRKGDQTEEPLAKGFSDSDEEPLAVKLTKIDSKPTVPQPQQQQHHDDTHSADVAAAAAVLTSLKQSGNHHLLTPAPQHPPTTPTHSKHTAKASKNDSVPSAPAIRSPDYSPVLSNKIACSPSIALSLESAAADVFESPHGYPRTPSYQPSPFKTPAYHQLSSPTGSMPRPSPTQQQQQHSGGRKQDSQIFKSPTAAATTPTSVKQHSANKQQSQSIAHQQQQQIQLQQQIQQHQQQQLAALAALDSNSTEAVSAILANLMPSKEESCKIFGIASVTLAQSSGPNDTKCTLGKCGSVHKPPLGPVVPTTGESGAAGAGGVQLSDAMSSKERRKAKVNMTHEQIQKWLSECQQPASGQDGVAIVDDLLHVDLSVPPVPINYLEAVSPVRDFVHAGSGGSQAGHASPPVSASPQTVQPPTATPTSTPTGTPKAKPNLRGAASTSKDVVQRNEVSSSTTSSAARVGAAASDTAVVRTSPTTPTTVAAAKVPTPIVPPAAAAASVEMQPQLAAKELQQQPPSTPQKTNNASAATKPSAATSVASSASGAGPKSTPTTASGNPKRTPVYNSPMALDGTREGAAGRQRTPIVNTFAAFSPENESSIYSFDKDEDFGAAATTVGKTRGTAYKRGQRNAVPVVEPEKKAEVVSQSPDAEASKSQTVVSPRTAPVSDDKKDHTTVAILPTSATPTPVASVEAATAAAAAAGSSHTFYIPLQGTPFTGGKSDQIIQGVAVKLGTEGPDGPNQRVIMHAKLVTKTQMAANPASQPQPTAIPEQLAVTDGDIVKSLCLSTAASGGQTAKDSPTTTTMSTKQVPIGTVQPRFKNSSNSEAADSDTHSSAAPQAVRPTPPPHPPPPPTTNSNSSSRRHGNEPPIQPDNLSTTFPQPNAPAQMVEALTFRPTEREFADPLEFFDRIYPLAARFGLCRVIPPASFRPECKISDDMRFTAYNQYVHKMLHRWGPSVKEFRAIRKYLATQRVKLVDPPWIGGMEVDLPRLYHTVQELGGLREVIEKKRWGRVAEEMCFPKTAQDRVSKLDDIYCKYLLPYDTLSPAERQKLFDEVEADWAKREAKARRSMASEDGDEDDDENDEDDANHAKPNGNKTEGKAEKKSDHDDGDDGDDDEADDNDDDDEDEDDDDDDDDGAMECIVEGRKMPLKQFFRIARNTMALWFKNTEPASGEIEAEFWRHVAVRDSHVCVHSGSIDSSGWGYGFPTPAPKAKFASTHHHASQPDAASACARHPWNLKVLTNNHGSILRSIGPITGMTVPTLHVGMLFSACCWYRDPHGLPWIEYLHTGGSKIWYGVPEEQSDAFREAFTALVPTHCQNTRAVWLPCDTAMVPPHMLTDRGVSLCRVEQQPGEFVIVFPRAYTSSVTTGYAISESVYFATSMWLDTAKEDFKDIHDSNEPAMFSLEQLLFAVSADTRTTNQTLDIVLPMMHEVFEREKKERDLIKAAGVTRSHKVSIRGAGKKSPPAAAAATSANKAGKKTAAAAAAAAAAAEQPNVDEIECDVCRANLYVSWVRSSDGGGGSGGGSTDDVTVYCLQHALRQIAAGRLRAHKCTMLYTYSIADVAELIERIQCRASVVAASTSVSAQQQAAAAQQAAQAQAQAQLQQQQQQQQQLASESSAPARGRKSGGKASRRE